jgi:hypothetical protein
MKKVLEYAKKEEKKLASKIANFLSVNNKDDEEVKYINPKYVFLFLEVF